MYCGLVSAGERLGVVLLSDSGRVTATVEVADSPGGYAAVAALVAEHAANPTGVPVAAAAEACVVAQLFAAAGRPVAFADPSAFDPVAEPDVPRALRAAAALADALRRGAVAAYPHEVSRDLAALRPVLGAHAAMLSGRQAVAATLRHVLRELYPAALAAFPDPTRPVPLAVIAALPEPGVLARSKTATVAQRLLTGGLAAEHAEVTAAVEALRARVDTPGPRRSGLGRSGVAVAATTVAQACAAVRDCDTGIAALVELLDDRVDTPTGAQRALAPPAPAPARRRAARSEDQPAGPAAPARPGAAPHAPAASAAPVGETGTDGPGSGHGPVSGGFPVAPGPVPTFEEPAAPPPVPAAGPEFPAATPRRTAADDGLAARLDPASAGRRRNLTGAFGTVRPTESGGPGGARRRGPEPGAPGGRRRGPEPAVGESAADPFGPGTMPVAPPVGPPVVNPQPTSLPAPPVPPATTRVPPPWQSDDLPAEPPALRLVEPAPLTDPALRGPAVPLPSRVPHSDAPGTPPVAEPRSLRSVRHSEGGEPVRRADAGRRRRREEPRAAAVVDDSGDGDLLIFAAARSAWFTDPEGDMPATDWASNSDDGWRAAEEASRPAVGGTTTGGLPRRVPQANLVPGTAGPLAPARPVRPVRDAAQMAAHTSGYFRGWRRGRVAGA